MKRSGLWLALVLLVMATARPAAAGDANAAAIGQVKALATRPAPSAPIPVAPREEWVSERRVWVPGLGVFATVPGHFERRISDTQSEAPPLTIFREADRAPLAIPAGERPPADIRSSP